MARPIGMFSVLMALGGFLAVRYVQNRRGTRFSTGARELSRWEGEGGNVAAPAGASGAASATPGAQGGNGSAYSNGDDRPWPFPRS
jgi:hypothetical protein